MPVSTMDTHERSTPDSSETSPLTKNPDSVAAYGIASSPSAADSDGEGFSKLGDEEALLAPPEEPDAKSPLSTKTILWIVLPMLLGECRNRHRR